MRKTPSTRSCAVGSVALLALVGVSNVASASRPPRRHTGSSAPAATSASAAEPVALPISRTSIEVPLASLPQGQMLDQDWSGKPAALPAGGKVAGVVIKRSFERYNLHTQPVIEISELKAKGEEEDGSVHPQSLCFDTANISNRSGQTPEPDQPPDRWTGGMITTTQLLRQQDVKGGYPMRDRVQQLHIEQLVLSAQGPALESRDAWIDAESGGARVHATARLPLRDLGERAVGVHLYAGRVGDEVVFLATQSPKARNLFAVRKDEGGSMTNCGHLSVRLDVKRGMSEMAAFETILQLANSTPPPPEEPQATIAEAQARAGVAFLNGKVAAPDTTPTVDTTTRTRLGRVAMSTSWEPNDAGPLLSFSESWGNRPHDE